MATRSQSYDIMKQFKRTSDVQVNKTFTDNMQLIAACHYANGDLDEAMAAMNMLGKVRAKTETEELRGLVQVLVQQMAANMGAEVPTAPVEPTE